MSFYASISQPELLHSIALPISGSIAEALPFYNKKVDVSEKYPYLLRGLVIQRPNQVWGTDITYIKLRQGFIYLVAVMDWFSRYVLSWEVSNSLDTFFCLSALEKALARNTPEIFNSDQGSQFTSEAFTSRLKAAEIRISCYPNPQLSFLHCASKLAHSIKPVHDGGI